MYTIRFFQRTEAKMKFSAKATAITLTISIILTVIFLFFMLNLNAKRLNETINIIQDQYINSSSFEESLKIPITAFGLGYRLSVIEDSQEHLIAQSESFGSKFSVHRDVSLDGKEWKIAIDMGGRTLFSISTVILFFLAVQGIGFAIIAPSQSEKKSREILYDITYKDSLTGAFNRKRLSRFFNARKLDNNAPFAMFYTDINNFNAINEKYGRHMGDDILKAFAKHLDSYVRDAIIVRLDGDDFVVTITGDFSEDILHSIKHRLDHAFSKPLVVNDKDIRLSVSVAYTSFPKEGQSLEKLLAVSAERIMKVKKENV